MGHECTIEYNKKAPEDLESALGTAKKTQEEMEWTIKYKTRRLEQKDRTMQQIYCRGSAGRVGSA